MSGLLRQSPSDGCEPQGAAEARDDSPLVGRATEWRLIERLLTDAQEMRRGALVLVEGPPGVGLSRFLREVERGSGDAVECVRLTAADAADVRSVLWRTVADRLAGAELPELPPASPATRPLVVVVPDVDILTRPVRRRLESLLDDLDRHPLLFVIGVWAGCHQGEPNCAPFHPWLAHPNVVHLRLTGLAAEPLALIGRARCPGATTAEVATMVRVANGSPAVVTELCRWHTRVVECREELSDAEALAAAPLLARRIGSSSAVRVQELAAACAGPVHAPSVAALLVEPVHAVRELLDGAVASGLLVREETCAVTGYTVAHPLVRTLIRALTGQRRWAEVNRRVADALIAGADEADLAGPRATVIARHLAAAADLPPGAIRYFLAAAGVAEREGDLHQARRWAVLGLAAGADEYEECRLLMIIGSVDERLGAVAQGVSTLARAHALAERTREGSLLLEAAVRLLDATRAGGPISVDATALAEQALTAAGADSPALRARLHAHLAIRSADWDEDAWRRHQTAARFLASSVDDDGGAAAAAIGAASSTPLPGSVESYLRLAQDASVLAGGNRLSALAPTVFANLALGRVAVVEVALEQLAAVERTHPSRWARVQLSVAALGLSVLHLDEARFVAAAHEALAEASPHIVRYLEFAVELWEASTGRQLPIVPRPVEEPAGRPPLGTFPLVAWLLSPRLLMSRTGTDAAARQTLDVVLANCEALFTRPRDASWSTWSVTVINAAVLTERWDLSRQALDSLLPYSDQFVILGHCLPVGPVGWYVASALHWLGRTDEALEANARASATSRRARSRFWMIYSHLQRAELLAGHDPRQARAVRQTALGYARSSGMADVLPQGMRHPEDGLSRVAADPRRRQARAAATATAEPQQLPSAGGPEAVRAAIESMGGPDLGILLLLMDGAGNAAIARVMRLSIPTVERRLTRLYRVLGASNRAQAAAVVAPLRSDIQRLMARPATRS